VGTEVSSRLRVERMCGGSLPKKISFAAVSPVELRLTLPYPLVCKGPYQRVRQHGKDVAPIVMTMRHWTEIKHQERRMPLDLNYLPGIKKKTGKTPEDFVALAIEKGLGDPTIKPGVRIKWLKEEFGLGHGHAMFMAHSIKNALLRNPSEN